MHDGDATAPLPGTGEPPAPGSGVTVRAAGPEDLDLADGLFTQYLDFYGVRPADTERSRTFLGQRLTRRDSLILLALAPDGTAVGLAQVYPGLSSLALGPAWLLHDLFVAPAGRRLGVGRALVREVLDRAREAEVSAVQLETAYDNEAAQKLYETEGFTRDPFHVYVHELR
ncbi:GNAT family N-acetyltransferase [Streptomyces albidoflavus]